MARALGHRLALVVLGALLVVPAAEATVRALDARSTGKPHEMLPDKDRRPGRGRVEQFVLTDASGTRHPVWVYRPGVPDSAGVPVVYFLHGLPGDDQQVADLDVVSLLDTAIVAQRLRPLVLVVPDGNTPAAADPEWADSVDGNVRLEDFVTRQLVAAVEGAHPRDRARRAITGMSMGGFGAARIGWRHPGEYGQVAVLSGYFHLDDPDHIFGRTPSAWDSPDHLFLSALTQRVFLADGTSDTLPASRGETQRMAALLRAVGIEPTLDLEPGSHNTRWLRAELPDLFSWLEAGWDP